LSSPNRNALSQEELDALLEGAAREPVSAPVEVSRGGARARVLNRQIRAWLDEEGITPGPMRGVEDCTLFRRYTAWAAVAGVNFDPMHPVWFSRGLTAIGFGSRREKSHGRDMQPRMMNEEAARRLKRWRDENPDSEQERMRFNPRTPKGLR
jgi:hypothetical protein